MTAILLGAVVLCGVSGIAVLVFAFGRSIGYQRGFADGRRHPKGSARRELPGGGPARGAARPNAQLSRAAGRPAGHPAGRGPRT